MRFLTNEWRYNTLYGLLIAIYAVNQHLCMFSILPVQYWVLKRCEAFRVHDAEFFRIYTWIDVSDMKCKWNKLLDVLC